MVYLKAIQKIPPMDVSVSGTIDEKRIWKNLGEGFSPPWIPLWQPPLVGPEQECNFKFITNG